MGMECEFSANAARGMYLLSVEHHSNLSAMSMITHRHLLVPV